LKTFDVAQAARPAPLLPAANVPTPVNPRSETASPPSGEATTELKPFEVAQAAAPIRVAPPARESPPAEARPLAPELAPSLEPNERIEAHTVPATPPASEPPAVQTTSLTPADLRALQYRELVMLELNRRKRYPEAARQSSGHAALDVAARQMINGLTLPPPPGGPVRVDLPIEFKIGG
jgi:hypothetical protein